MRGWLVMAALAKLDPTEVAVCQRLADQGDAKAQLTLGGMLGFGHGVARDAIAGYVWLNLAAAQGNSDAAVLRDALVVEMTPDHVQKAQAQAAAWKPTTTSH